jgi:ABC-type transport system involved in multi-copper enzyme maturation permease subunit
MRIFYLELRRIVKTRRVLVMLIVSVVLSVLMAVTAVQGVRYDYLDKAHNTSTITGLAAVKALYKENNDAYVGPVTVEKLKKALKTCQDVYQKYDQNFMKIPSDVYNQKIVPIEPFLQAILQVYFPYGSGGYEDFRKLDPNRLENFYTQRFEVIKGTLKSKYPGNQSVLRQAEELNAKSGSYFTFTKGDPGGVSRSLTFLAFLLVAIGAMITAPNFAAEYQSGADDIFRSARYGRRRFVVAKLCASLVLLAIMFIVCSLIFILLVDNAVGWDGFRTSMQLTFPTGGLAPLNFLQAQLATVLAAFLSLLATACVSLFISTKCRNSTTALVISIAIFMAPIMLGFVAGNGGNMIDLLTYALPGGSVGLQEYFYVHLINRLSFVQIGPFSVWTPDLMLGACALEIPVFLLLAVHAYCRHQAA